MTQPAADSHVPDGKARLSEVSCRDPHAIALMAPGALYETRTEVGGAHAIEVFAHHPRTLCDIYRQAAQPADRRALISDGVEVSAGKLFGGAAALAAWLKAQGVAVGDTIGIALPAGLGWATAFIAITAIGAQAALVNTRGVGEEMAHALRAVNARMVIADQGRCDAILPHLGDGDMRVEPEAVIGRAAEEFAASAFQPLHVLPEHGAILLYTSGTTGRPKPVLHSHGSLAHMAVLGGLLADLQDRAWERETGLKIPENRRAASAVTVIASPPFHVGGITPFIRGMYFHAPLFFMAKWDTEAAFALMERETVTRLGFVPAMLLDMIRSPRAGEENLGSITLLSNGAAALDAKLVAEIRSKMPRVMLANSYGQTESGGWGTSIYGSDYLAHSTSAGYVLPTVRMRIADPAGRTVPRGAHGEILLHSAAVMREYLGDQQATAAALRDGWLHTGDIGWLDEDGRLFIADRLKNMIISGGENVYAAEVERVLGDYAGVRESFAFGMPDERLGERVTALVVAEPEAKLDPQALRRYARERLAGYKVPKQIIVTSDPLPRTPTMKVDRAASLRMARERAQNPSA